MNVDKTIKKLLETFERETLQTKREPINTFRTAVAW